MLAALEADDAASDTSIASSYTYSNVSKFPGFQSHPQPDVTLSDDLSMRPARKAGALAFQQPDSQHDSGSDLTSSSQHAAWPPGFERPRSRPNQQWTEHMEVPLPAGQPGQQDSVQGKRWGRLALACH